ncbi:C4-dicarboxylate ABC transporter substrate-binding protein [Billgrantia pellis]|uniref:C4-dicarboxylate ABC transporter substrate-binding protein n=1 Tax=Billgrantia pellis TaxID=2606936 RepID=A0A7V7G4G6_9GAMM|nr:C4-dicarboxylate TRAP transporter substrate-binding protein [Halomonas pellis]KAA0014587.1 C4-dicarboxylate ABC transporter substrate-binding protein [Halomonas pellis]
MKTTSKALAVSAMLAIPTLASAQYIANVGWAPTHIITKNAYLDMAESLKEASGGDLMLEVYTGGSLIDVRSTLQGVSNGIAQVGFVTGAYLPSDLPLNNVIADMAFVADDPTAAALAFTEVNFTEPKLRDEWQDNGVLFGGGYSTPVYKFICNTPVETPDDLKGLKIRTAGASHIRWVEHMGAVPVSVPFSEVYTGLQLGSIDCAMADTTSLVSGFRIAEVAKHVTELPMGTHTSGATWVMNPGFWQGLSAEQKSVLFDEFAQAIARMQVDYEQQADRNLELGINEHGVELVEPSDELQQALAAFNEAYINTLADVSMENRGVNDPTDIIDAYLAAEARWKERLAEVDRHDTEAIASLLKEAVYDQLDLASYGL